MDDSIQHSVGFIGAGNIARCLMAGLVGSGWEPHQIVVSDPDPNQLERMQQRHPVSVTSDNDHVAQTCSVIILAVKPQIMRGVCRPLTQALGTRKPLIMSVAAGIRIKDIGTWLGDDLPIVRVMPNTPALLGYGASGLYANRHVSQAQRQTADTILSAVGITRWVEAESEMDSVTAVSGTGPAYFFLLMEALEAAATELGMEAEVARDLIAQTAIGSAYMMRDSGKPPGLLRENVTSPGGTTLAAMTVFEDHQALQVIQTAVMAAHRRACEMAEAFGREE